MFPNVTCGILPSLAVTTGLLQCLRGLKAVSCGFQADRIVNPRLSFIRSYEFGQL